MSPPVTKIVRAVEAAAELRALGHSWEYVARKVRRSPDTVRRWPRLYPDLWARVATDTRRDRTTEAAGEAVAVLRDLLRSEDEKVRREAARDLLARAPDAEPAESSPPAATRFHLIADYLGGLTDDDRRQLLDQALAHYAGGDHPHAVVEPPPGPGPDGRE